LPLTLDIVADQAARGEAEAALAAVISEVRAETALLDAEEAHVAALAELEKGDVKQAASMLQAAQKSLALAAPSPANTAKMAAMARDESRLEQATRDRQVQESMKKASKSSAYQSAKGQKQGLMLQRGDKGYLVEKLQQALKDQGYYGRDVDGLFGPDLEEAVQKFQQSKSLPVDGIAGPATLGALGL
ncbi:MAG: peptidoglycan-binding protein, partial [Deltaproteobacteria bacterium]|nr:peptidoglycan-binding protein [Deltaproteobacteria bacterium]